MKPLQDVLALMQLNVNLYHNARVCGEWLIEEHSKGATCFHMSSQDGYALKVPGHGEWELKAGDLVIFPREIPHQMFPASRFPGKGPQRHLSIPEAQNIPGTSMLCGAVSFRHHSHTRLLDALPPVLIIKKSEETPWLDHLFGLIHEESLHNSHLNNPTLSRLCELLITYAVRHFVENNGLSQTGAPKQTTGNQAFLALFAHPQISRALSAIHAQPGAPWTLERMAEKAAMSRTAFANTFREVGGMTPGDYLMWWRMQNAWKALEEGQSVIEVAERFGYRAEASFSRAFHSYFGTTAGRVRRGTAKQPAQAD